MTILHFWEPNILAKCTNASAALSLIALLILTTAPLSAQPCADTARTWRTTATKTALAACAAQNIAPAQLAMAQAALDANQFAQAVSLAQSAATKLPAVKDVAAWIEASAQFGLKDYDATLAALPPPRSRK